MRILNKKALSFVFFIILFLLYSQLKHGTSPILQQTTPINIFTKLPKKDRVDLAMQQEFEKTKDPALGFVPRERLYKAYEKAQEKRRLSVLNKSSAAIANVDWVERGPKNFAGRTRAMMIDPNDISKLTLFSASVAGGLWVCTDISATTPVWTSVNDFFENMAITTLAYDPSNTQTMYFGTGEGWFNVDAVQGDGIFKSTDGGNTWAQLTSTAGNSTFNYVEKIIVHPSNNDVYAVTRNGGIQRSQNGGTSWSTVLASGSGASTSRAADIEFAADNNIYASMGIFTTDGVYKSSTGNNGSWTKLNSGSNGFPTTGFERIELACAPSNSQVVYAFTQNSANFQIGAIYKTTDGGGNWTTLTNPNSADPNHSDYTNGQAWYDLTAAVDPNNSNIVYTGGIDLYKSADGGSSWQQFSHWYGGFGFQEVHADQHAIIFEEGNSDIIYFGNDGGVFRTTDGTSSIPTLISRNFGYNTIQFYACAIHPDAFSNHFLGGTQDNGSHRFNNPGINNTIEVTGGDGAFCFIDQDESQYQFTSYVYNNFYRSIDNGQSFSSISYSNSGRFINPSDYDDTNNRLYSAHTSGRYLIWQNPQTGSTFRQKLISSFNGAIPTAVTVSPNVGNRVYFGTDEGRVVRVNNANSSASGTYINSGSGMPSGYITCIEIENGDENHILVCYSNYGLNSVWETTNGGSTWASVEGDLPDMPVRWVVFNPTNNDQALVATELGVWSTDNLNGGSTVWEPSNTGLANVRTDMLQIRSSDNVMIAATHGRGLYSSDVFAAANADFIADNVLGYQSNSTQFTDGSASATSWLWDFGDGGTSTQQHPSHVYNSDGKYTVALTINGGEASEIKTDYILILPNRGTPYLAAAGGDFETNPDDFGADALTGSINILERGTPANTLTTLNSLSNGWKTDLDADVLKGTYSCGLYSPSFNLSVAGTYTLQFRKSMDAEFTNAPFGVYVEYSVDQGLSWSLLGTDQDPLGTNWYERGTGVGSTFHDVTPDGYAFCGNYTNENTAYDISSLAGNSFVCFRIIFIIETGWGVGYLRDGFMVDDFEILGETNDVSLPVELSSFSVAQIARGKGFELQWQTESETENAFWIIERKNSGSLFKQIGRLNGQGNKATSTEYSFIDYDVKYNADYTYRLGDISYAGKIEYHDAITVSLKTPDQFELAQNYPNPFNPSTQIKYTLANAGKVELSVFNALGQRVLQLVNREQNAGSYSITFNAGHLSSGLYFYTLKTAEKQLHRKMLLLK